MITAIIDKRDPINAEDLRRAWVDHMNPSAAGLVSEPFEGALLALAKTHIPASDIGKYCDLYSGTGMVYSQSYANEIVTKAICVMRMTQGNTWEAMKAGLNMGRDTDCLTAVAGGISGALSGADSIPSQVITQVDHATSVNPHTNSKRTLDPLLSTHTSPAFLTQKRGLGWAFG